MAGRAQISHTAALQSFDLLHVSAVILPAFNSADAFMQKDFLESRKFYSLACGLSLQGAPSGVKYE